MAKILKNTTASDIELFNIGRTIEASGQLELETTDLARVASDESITELTSLINSGDIVVNDGTSDLDASIALDYIQYPNTASNILFDNSVANLDLTNDPSNVQKAIENLKGFRVQSPQFQEIGTLNFDQYLYAYKDAGGPRSGNTSNGYRFSNSAPIVALYSGTVISAAAAIKGAAVSTGSPAANVTLNFELWKVGFNGEGTKLGDITFDIDSSQYTVGTFWNSSIDTNFGENQTQDVDVTAGDLLALKFIRVTGSSDIVEIRNATIVLEIEGFA